MYLSVWIVLIWSCLVFYYGLVVSLSRSCSLYGIRGSTTPQGPNPEHRNHRDESQSIYTMGIKPKATLPQFFGGFFSWGICVLVLKTNAVMEVRFERTLIFCTIVFWFFFIVHPHPTPRDEILHVIFYLYITLDENMTNSGFECKPGNMNSFRCKFCNISHVESPGTWSTFAQQQTDGWIHSIHCCTFNDVACLSLREMVPLWLIKGKYSPVLKYWRNSSLCRELQAV